MISNLLKKDKLLLIFLIGMSLFLFFYKIGAASLFETDEVIYSQVAREIVRTGDWITLHLFSKNWFIHPPFYMWLTAASSYIFGVNEFNTRLWNALFAVGLVFVTYLLGKKLFKGGVGLLAGFILATSLQYILQARLAIFDIPYIFFITIGIYLLLCYFDDGKDLEYYAAFLMLGLSIFMKGPIGLLLPLLILTPYLFFTRQLIKLYNLKFILGMSITALVGGWWYVSEIMLHGSAFYDSVIKLYLIGRFTTSIEAHYGPIYFYIPVVFFGLFPWSPFLIFSIYYQVKKKSDNANLLTIIWLLVVFLFFTAAKTKLPGYIMSLYPMAAISVAKFINDHMFKEDAGHEGLMHNAYKTLAVFSVLLVIVGTACKVFEFPEVYDRIMLDLCITFVSLGFGGILAAVYYFRNKYSMRPVMILVATMMIFSVITANMTMIDLDDFKPMKAISQRINHEYKAGQVIIGYDVLNKGSFLFYLDKDVLWAKDRNILRQKIATSKKIYLITNEKDLVTFRKEFANELFLVYKAGGMVLLSNIR